jgi:hypothetical protein
MSVGGRLMAGINNDNYQGSFSGSHAYTPGQHDSLSGTHLPSQQ